MRLLLFLLQSITVGFSIASESNSYGNVEKRCFTNVLPPNYKDFASYPDIIERRCAQNGSEKSGFGLSILGELFYTRISEFIDEKAPVTLRAEAKLRSRRFDEITAYDLIELVESKVYTYNLKPLLDHINMDAKVFVERFSVFVHHVYDMSEMFTHSLTCNLQEDVYTLEICIHESGDKFGRKLNKINIFLLENFKTIPNREQLLQQLSEYSNAFPFSQLTQSGGHSNATENNFNSHTDQPSPSWFSQLFSFFIVVFIVYLAFVLRPIY